MSGVLNLLIFRHAKNAETSKIAPTWNAGIFIVVSRIEQRSIKKQLWNCDGYRSNAHGRAARGTLYSNLDSQGVASATSSASRCASATAGRESDHQEQDGSSP